jgi:hypothetical protein
MGLAFESFRRLPLVLDAERATENGPSTGGRTGAVISSDVMGARYTRSPMTK